METHATPQANFTLANPPAWMKRKRPTFDVDINPIHSYMASKKARWLLNKNATSYIEQILEATAHETRAVEPYISHL